MGTRSMLLLLFALPFVSAAQSLVPISKEVRDENWPLVFDEEFDSPQLDLDRWTTCYWWNKQGCTNLANKELQWYLPANVTVSDGLLRLEARPEKVLGLDGKVFDYTSGMVTTGRDYEELPRSSRASFKYGYFEVKAKAPQGKSLWSAIWLLPDNRKSRPEIDIMEVLGDSADKLRMHFHYLDKEQNPQSVGSTAATNDLTTDWQVYGLLWTPGKIVWYLNGMEKFRFEEAPYIPDVEMYLLMNLAVGSGEWTGPPDQTTTFPAEYLIDYVRVWRWTG